MKKAKELVLPVGFKELTNEEMMEIVGVFKLKKRGNKNILNNLRELVSLFLFNKKTAPEGTASILIS